MNQTHHSRLKSHEPGKAARCAEILRLPAESFAGAVGETGIYTTIIHSLLGLND